MNLTKFKLAFICFVIAITACNNTKVNPANSVFAQFAPATKEYKNALAAQIKSNVGNLTYTFNQMVEENGKDYLAIAVQGPDFNATTLILVNNWNKLEGIKRTKGISYSGAQLRGLQLAIEENPSGANLIYKDLESIVD